jgi:hypothetical protein
LAIAISLGTMAWRRQSTSTAGAKDGKDAAGPGDGRTRERLAFTILVVGLAGMLVLGALVIYFEKVDRAREAHFVFGSILPLLASWIGTVLAYYYSRENFAAATRSVTDMAKEMSDGKRLTAIGVKDKMIAIDKIRTLVASNLAAKFQDIDAIKLSVILTYMGADPAVQRLPVWDDGKVMKYMIHRSKITDFISSKVSAPAGSAAADLTLKDLIADSALKQLFTTSFAAVSPDKTLADAKLVMESTPHCEDVFVTKTGKKEDEVLGWITDNMISDTAKL